MKPLSIRARLTIWYTAILTLALLAFGAATWIAMRHNLLEAVDRDLGDRVEALRVFMDQAASMDEIRDEFAENAALGPGGDLFQVRDKTGAWMHRSPPLDEAQVPLAQRVPADEFADSRVRNHQLRTLARTVTARGTQYTLQVATSVDDVFRALDVFRWILLALTPGMLVVAAAGGAWISRRALRPLTDMMRAVESIHANSLSRRLIIEPTGDELQRLAETFNSMLDRLEDSFTRMVRFTGDASHELRTPIALIRTASEVALRKVRSVEEYQEALREIGTESERLTTLIGDLLTLARADSGLGLSHPQEVELGRVAEEAMSHISTLAAGRQIQLRFEPDALPVFVRGDHIALQRVITILLDNAVKYSADAADVIVRVTRRDGAGTIEVADHGLGIGESELPLIFERFYRADKARNRDSGGTGLGLAIAHWIVDIHRGRIEVSSVPGEGSTFRVILPEAG